jgi:magnesium chelatase family protein
MSLAVLRSRALAGMEAPLVNVEVHLANGLPRLTIVGLPDAEVRESKDRVMAALESSGFDVPARRITVNLAPADLPKESGRFDLPIALGILAASGQIPARELVHYEFAGELSLTGQLRPARGALAMALAIQREHPARGFFLPQENADEAALVDGARIYPAQTLLQVCTHLKGLDQRIAPHPSGAPPSLASYPDFADVKGQQQVKRALEIAACGLHSVLLVGPPGSGKSMLAARFPGLLPPMSDEEALEAAAVQSLSTGFHLKNWKQRPFRCPHHTSSGVALVGGGNLPRPGEISLAHGGVLFLDELPEFDRRVLEVLRQPLESGRITISRAAHQADFPANFQLIAAMNPCPCGWLGHASGKCRCSGEAVLRYQSRISGPLLDRIDLQIEVGAIAPDILGKHAPGESSAVIAARIGVAWEAQLTRQGKGNARLGAREIEQVCRLDSPGEKLLQSAMLHMHWSARAYHRVLRVARTIADLDGATGVLAQHVAEAVQCRRGLRDG